MRGSRVSAISNRHIWHIHDEKLQSKLFSRSHFVTRTPSFGRDEAAAGLEAAEVTVPLCWTLKEKDKEELSEDSAEIPQLQIEIFCVLQCSSRAIRPALTRDTFSVFWPICYTHTAFPSCCLIWPAEQPRNLNIELFNQHVIRKSEPEEGTAAHSKCSCRCLFVALRRSEYVVAFVCFFCCQPVLPFSTGVL